MISVAMQAVDNPDRTSDASMLDHTALLPILKHGYVLATLDWRPRRPCILQLHAEYDQGWARECLRVQMVTGPDKKLWTSWKVMKLSQVVSVGSVLTCRDTSFVDQVAGVLSYFLTFVGEYGLQFLKAKPGDVSICASEKSR